MRALESLLIEAERRPKAANRGLGLDEVAATLVRSWASSPAALLEAVDLCGARAESSRVLHTLLAELRKLLPARR